MSFRSPSSVDPTRSAKSAVANLRSRRSTPAGGTRALPHDEQNRASSLFSCSQTVHWSDIDPAPQVRQSTLTTRTGRGIPFAAISREPDDANRPPASASVSSLARISPPCAAAAIRAALCTSAPL